MREIGYRNQGCMIFVLQHWNDCTYPV